MYTRREMRLVSLVFTLVLAAYEWHKTNPKATREQITDWARKAMRDMGYNVSDPVGSSWGVLLDGTKYLEPEKEGIHIESADRPE